MKKTLIFLVFLVFITNIVSANESFVKTNSKSIIAIDRKSLSTLYEKNGYNSVPMASTTKIMTCIIALENSSMDSTVSISRNASKVSGSTLGLKEGQIITMNDLLYGLMLRSGNDCAVAIAEYISGNIENFSILMNKKAQDLALYSTHFISPHGLDNPDHYTSPYDLAILTNYALNNEDFKKIVSTKQYTIYISGNPRIIQNTNELLGNFDGVYGVKTGFTFEAGRCLVSACKRNNFDIIVVVLGADTKKVRTDDSKKIINYIFQNFQYCNLENEININFTNIIKNNSNIIKLEKTITTPEFYLEHIDNYEFPFLKNTLPNLTYKLHLAKTLSNITSKDSIVGSFELYDNSRLILKKNIFLKNDLVSNSWNFYLKKCLSLRF